eukprot:365525-Chlamydomonas_euryale.AAC.2
MCVRGRGCLLHREPSCCGGSPCPSVVHMCERGDCHGEPSCCLPLPEKGLRWGWGGGGVPGAPRCERGAAGQEKAARARGRAERERPRGAPDG